VWLGSFWATELRQSVYIASYTLPNCTLALSATFPPFEVNLCQPNTLFHSFCYRTVLNLALACHVPRVPPSSFPMHVQVGKPGLDVLWYRSCLLASLVLVLRRLWMSTWCLGSTPSFVLLIFCKRLFAPCRHGNLYCSRCVRFSRDASAVNPSCVSCLNRSLRHVGVPVLRSLELTSVFLQRILGALARMDLSWESYGVLYGFQTFAQHYFLYVGGIMRFKGTDYAQFAQGKQKLCCESCTS
jgi:hypothetical protein